MDFGISSAEKLAMLTNLKTNTNVEIYQLLLRCGIDPDTFESVDQIDDALGMTGEKVRIKTLLDARAVIESKIAALS